MSTETTTLREFVNQGWDDHADDPQGVSELRIPIVMKRRTRGEISVRRPMYGPTQRSWPARFTRAVAPEL
jgi:hypothetical protein